MARTALFGGSFNPIHYGHLLLADEVRERLGLDRVVFMPAGVPPHKPASGIAPAADRYAMVSLAIADNPAFAVSDLELRRTGPSYTVDTVDAMGLPPAQLFLVMGSETFLDLLSWREPQRLAAGLPEEFTQLPRPIIGYVGGLHRHMDFELLRCVAGRRPEWTFTLIGPEQADVSALRALPNIRLLGGRAIEALPRYINAFDVGIIPYVESAYTRTVYPTKLNEYHALGKPVVSTPLPEVQAFNERHGGLVYLGGTPDEFEAQLERALAQRNGELAQRRIAVARENAWSERIAQMSCLMEERMAERAAAAPQRWRERFLAASESARRRLTWIVATVALSYLGVFYTPVLWWVAEPLRISEAPEISDAIVVFAGGVGESGRAGQGYEERVAWAVDLYRRGYAPRLIFSSGYTYRFHETEVMAALARALGVPDSAIWLEAAAVNTLDNVRLTGGLMRQQGWRSALLVSSPYHMRRAALVWRRLAPELRLRCVPIRESLFYTRGAPRASGLRRQATPTQVQAIAHEYLSLLYYWLKGRL